VLIAVAGEGAKPLSSRQAMEATRGSSPFYRAWVRSAGGLLAEAVSALERRDLEKLGELARLSYSRMHAALLAADPPLLYWLPATVALVRECAALRRAGLGAWETVDAGPQVKVLCLEADAPRIAARWGEAGGAVKPACGAEPACVRLIECRPGPAPAVQVEGE
jgi:diphosphomevalonate decarboxylase